MGKQDKNVYEPYLINCMFSVLSYGWRKISHLTIHVACVYVFLQHNQHMTCTMILVLNVKHTPNPPIDTYLHQ